MIIVSDTTAISNLIQIGEIDLLQNLFGKIIIPNKVYEELLVLEELSIPIESILKEDWIDVRAVNSEELLKKLKINLDQGEVEAIALAIELNADHLLIDEKEGRKIARSYQLEIIGTIGILLKAKQSGLVESVKSKMDDLKAIGFWINDKLYSDIVEIEKKL